MFGLYGMLRIISLLLYRPLSPVIEANYEAPPAPLNQSRRLVNGMAALFGMDSFGTGFLVQSLLALWLYQSFSISVATAASILFWTSICSAISYLVAVPIAARIGIINTMVSTHLPSQRPADPDPVRTRSHHRNRLAASAQRAIANGCADAQLLRHGRGYTGGAPGGSQDLRWGAGSIIAGYLLAISTFGWPLVIAGVVKGVYDILLLINFQKVRPPEEVGALPVDGARIQVR